MTKATTCLTATLVSLLAWTTARSQESVTAPRSDGQVTPMSVYRASSRGGCAPLAVLSPGAGGTENDYRYLAQGLGSGGFTVIVMGHRESGPAAVRATFWHNGMGKGMSALVGSREAETARLLDTGAALTWSDHQCRAPFRVLIGHSMGAETVMLEAGATNAIGISSPPAAQHRFDAYIAMSPEGPGLVFPDHAWSTLHVSMLVLTGTRDQTIPGGGGPAARQIPWKDMPASSDGCRWMGVLADATHMNFAGRGPGANSVTPVVVDTIRNYLSQVQHGSCRDTRSSTALTLSSK
ncbi:alpha/beta hydrolase family protein [Terriglobus roseus]|uniref:Alpha/beta hydrolase family protein n=1 Tax=Terriglobus roseus TaxID=392734 RepID=A0A1H4PNV4_9BACT|nr:alpha/beta hydrolase [Terriglobus roseus]SEC09153.1 hypothetical protein SAMN05443244_2627 [Terriglobus roseus]